MQKKVRTSLIVISMLLLFLLFPIQVSYAFNKLATPNMAGGSLFLFLLNEETHPKYGADALPDFAEQTAWDEFIQRWHETNMPNMPALVIDEVEYSDSSQPVWVPVMIDNVSSEDDVKGLQFRLSTSHDSLLRPAEELSPRLGNAFSAESYIYSTTITNTWYFLGAMYGEIPVINQPGLIAEFPFYVEKEGCTFIEIDRDIVSNSLGQRIRSRNINQMFCTNNSASVEGEVYLESRFMGNYDNIEISISNSSNTYTTTTNADGYYSFPSIKPGTYTIKLTKDLFVSRIISDVMINSPIIMPEIGLWSGDIDQDHDVDLHDWNILKASIIPVGHPLFDINADTTTNVGDSIIQTNNFDRDNMTITNPPRPRVAGRVASKGLEVDDKLRSEIEPDIVRSAHQDSALGWTLQTQGLIGQLDSVGVQLSLSEDLIITDVTLAPALEDGFLSWYQEENKLYIVAAPAEGRTVTEDANLLFIHATMSSPERATTIVITASNMLGWSGELLLKESKKSQDQLYFPMIIR